MTGLGPETPDEETLIRPRVSPKEKSPTETSPTETSPTETTDAADSSIDADTVIRVPPPTAPTRHAQTPPAQPPHAQTPPAQTPPAPATAPPALVEPAEPVAPPIEEVLYPLTPPRERVFAYGFRVNNGRAVSLESPVLIGRAPTPPRIPTGERPVLARVESPNKEVSGTHLELRQHGALVIATDLRSTNGTTVTPPGRGTQKLRQGESVVVQPGTVIDIGDSNVVEILPLQSRESD
ncbi:FHA domain-containing protein [Lacisediminihabitans changchengi]|uniref:FHA domain-containing protein n=1 Tax=Lacisediminihabitans changchengi TaxID=2787634 RepID=A0A934SIZ1_9MICO|nr:FHA domain-containing protein [Lacisediminihabitans changchengi]MBK4347511.1 FHA domain-containing protein [Lacisediminihabitans changchengi]